MIRLRSDEIILRDGALVYIGHGAPGNPAPVMFASLREMNEAIVRAVFGEFIRRQLSTSKAYWETAEELGYESGSSVQKIVSAKRVVV